MRLDSGQMMALAELARRQAAVQQQIEVCWEMFVPANRIEQITGRNRSTIIRQMAAVGPPASHGQSPAGPLAA